MSWGYNATVKNSASARAELKAKLDQIDRWLPHEGEKAIKQQTCALALATLEDTKDGVLVQVALAGSSTWSNSDASDVRHQVKCEVTPVYGDYLE